MPNTLSALPSSVYKLSHDPTQSIIGSPSSDLSQNPYTEMTEEILFGAVNSLLGDIDAATGLDLLGFATKIEDLLFPGTSSGDPLPDLLDGLFGWLTPNTKGATGTWGDGIFGQGVPAFSLTGTAPPNIFDLLPIGSLSGLVSPNLLSNPIFDLTAPFFGGTDWTLDTATNSPDTNSGSAKVTADGGPHELYSNPISMAPKHRVELKISAMFAGLVSTGNPIQLQIEQYFKGQRLDDNPVVLAVIPSGTASSDWQDMTGGYTGPVGVDEIRAVLHIDPTATAGTINFSAGSWTKSVAQELIPAEWIEGLHDGLTSVDNFFQQGLDNIHNAIDGGGAVNVYLTDVFNQIDDWWNDTQTTAATASDAHGGLTDTITAFVNGITQKSAGTGTFPGLSDMFGAALTKSKEVSNIAAGLAELKADKAAQQNSGMSYYVNIAAYAAGGVPSVFTQTTNIGGGSVINDGDTLEWSGADGTEIYVYNVGALATDNFEVSVVIPRATDQYFLNGHNNYIYLVGRSNAAGTSQCICQIGYNTVRFGCIRAGVSTMASPEWFGPAQGASMSGYVKFRGGVAGDSYFFQMLQNDRPVVSQDDSSHISLMGSAYRDIGWGMQAEAQPNGVLTGDISAFYGNDNTPVPVLGSGAKMTRLSTNQIGVTDGLNYMPTGFFDNLEISTNDISANVSNSSFTVSQEGWYNVSLIVRVATNFPNRFYYVLTKNGGALRNAQDQGHTINSVGASVLRRQVAANWVEYFHAGDVVGLGYSAETTSANVMTGTADGTGTCFTITRGWQT